MKSILQDEKECWVTGGTRALHKHHIFGGANRPLSEKYGLFVYLTPPLHNTSDIGVEFCKPFMDEMRKDGQRAFERVHGSRADFKRIFGKNYL